MKTLITIVTSLFTALIGVSAQSINSISDEDVLYTAATLYGEGYLEGPEGMLAILEVIENRADYSHLSLKQVVLAPWQFSAWNDDSPSRETLEKLASGQSSQNELIDAAFDDVVALTRDALEAPDRDRRFDRSVRHYWAHEVMEESPYWYGGQPVQVVGGHTFAMGVS